MGFNINSVSEYKLEQNEHSSQKAYLIVTLVYILSRVYYYGQGVRFDNQYLTAMWAYIDPVLLTTRLFESMFYLHSQPPLFNLLLGVVLKGFPNHIDLVLHGIFMLVGLCITWSMYYLAIRLEISSVWAIVLVSIFVISPAAILYENFSFYTYPVAGLLCLACAVLAKLCKNPKIVTTLFFVLLCTSLLFLRSTFQLPWIIMVFITAIIAMQGKSKKAILVVAIIPFLLIVGLYGKNYFVFHTVTTSSWLGMNVAKSTLGQFSKEEITELYQQGHLSALALIGPFKSLDDYRTVVQLDEHYFAVPALDNERKVDGEINFNHYSYILLSKQFQQDATYLIHQYPTRWLSGVSRAFGIYMYPPSNYYLLDSNRSKGKVRVIDNFYNRIIYGQMVPIEKSFFLPDAKSFKVGYMGFLFIFLLPLAVLHMARKGYRMWRAGNSLWLLYAFILANIFYVTLASNLIEIGENNRFRFGIEPLLFIIIGVTLQDYWRKYKLT